MMFLVAYATLLSYLTLTPDPWWILGSTGRSVEVAVDSTLADYIQHVIAFGVLGVLLAVNGRAATLTRRTLLVTFGLGHAIGTECLQQWIPMRSCTVTDLVSNVVGLVAGWWLLKVSSNQITNLLAVHRTGE